MSNNVFVGPNAVVAHSAVSFATAGINSTNTGIIYKADTGESFVPGRSINGITGFEVDEGYYMVMLVAMDLTAYVVPPVGDIEVDPVLFFDTFVGTAGAYSGHTPNKGAATTPTTGGLIAPTLDGSGNLLFSSSGAGQLKVSTALSGKLKYTAVVTSMVDTKEFYVTFLKSVGLTSYTYIDILDNGDGTLAHTLNQTVSGTNTAVATQEETASFPVTLEVTYDPTGGTVSSQVNSNTALTHAVATTGSQLQYGDIVSTGGASIASFEIRTVA